MYLTLVLVNHYANYLTVTSNDNSIYWNRNFFISTQIFIAEKVCFSTFTAQIKTGFVFYSKSKFIPLRTIKHLFGKFSYVRQQFSNERKCGTFIY
ncbi:hypothetical protein SAMD00079811_76150 (plasmid) [Scytonema sp. HK-05]|nr:hypothetical protein SAMD00079811_76150 [Scytonema sp. HK-05]